MDFDDLDDAEEAARPPAYEPEDYMPPVIHNFRFPNLQDIGEKPYNAFLGSVRSANGSVLKDEDRKICLRVFALTGAGDAVMNWWKQILTAPPWVQVIVHEWPSHGTRVEEEPCATLEALTDDAFKGISRILEQHQESGRFPRAPFAFMGHSIGALLMTALSKRLRDEMGLEPAACVVLDRAPPHMPLFSPFGVEKQKTNPMEFLDEYYPVIAMNSKKVGGESGAKMAKMWLDDVSLASDTREVDWYKFPCELLVLRARKNEDFDLNKDKTPEQKRAHEVRDKLMFSSPGSAMDFDFAQFEEWHLWSSSVTILDIDANHIGVKDHKDAEKAYWDFLAKVKAPDPPKK